MTREESIIIGLCSINLIFSSFSLFYVYQAEIGRITAKIVFLLYFLVSITSTLYSIHFLFERK